jgi:hypothetical protein
MNKIDLIIEFCESMANMHVKGSVHALAAARELRELKPAAYMDSKGVLFNDTTHPQLNTALYALDEVKHD